MSEITYDRVSHDYRDERGRKLDCVECNGSSRYLYPDGTQVLDDEVCYTCGNTGWQPPVRAPDAHCTECKCPLWFGVRGPKWFSLGDGPVDERSRPICSHCLRRLKFRRRHPEFSEPSSNEITLDDYKPRGEDS